MKIVTVTRCDDAQHFDRSGGDFGPDAISGEDGDVCFHIVFISLLLTSFPRRRESSAFTLEFSMKIKVAGFPLEARGIDELKKLRCLTKIFFKLRNLRLVLQQESKLIDAREQAMLRKRFEREFDALAVGQPDRLRSDIDLEFDARMFEQILVLALA